MKAASLSVSCWTAATCSFKVLIIIYSPGEFNGRVVCFCTLCASVMMTTFCRQLGRDSACCLSFVCVPGYRFYTIYIGKRIT